jgi:hypothetical protein
LGNNFLKLHKNFEYLSNIEEVARQNLGTGSHRLYQTTSQRGRSGGSYVIFWKNSSLKLHKNFEHPGSIGAAARQNLWAGSHRPDQAISQRGRSGTVLFLM